MAIHFDCMWQSPLQVGVGQWLNSNWWNVCESGTYHIQAAHYPLYVILTFSPHLLAVRVILRPWLFKGNRTNCKMEEIWVPEWHSPLLLICTGIKHECERNFFVMKPIKIWDCLLKQLPCCNTEDITVRGQVCSRGHHFREVTMDQGLVLGPKTTVSGNPKSIVQENLNEIY